MSATSIPFGDARAQKKWSAALFIQTMQKSYFDRKFIGLTDEHAIQRLTDLESGAGDEIQYDLSVQLRQKPTYGDNRLEGKEESLKFNSDKVKIDQMRHGVSAGGKMTRKRTNHNLRNTGKNRLSDYWSKFIDEMIFIYLSGARGINADFIEDIEWAGHAENPIQAPDDMHIIYGGAAKSQAEIDENCIMERGVIERAEVQARMMAAKDPKSANMMPMMINGEPHYVCVMSPFQEHQLRTKDERGWLDIQKAAATAEGKSNAIFKGGLGMINNTVLHSHTSSIRFDDFGAAENLEGGRALFMGRQAGTVAFGSSGGFRFTWAEKAQDYGNEPTVSSGTICGVKKSRFGDQDFGVISIDTFSPDPNQRAA
jgi:N4-gp56 family major capsid protein